MNFLFLVVLSLFSSTYSDFIDALYYEKIGNYVESYSIVERINSSQKDSYLYKYLYDLALKGFRTNQLSIDKLSENIEKIIELEPNIADNWILYAAVKAQQGDMDKAREGYKKAIELDPKNIEAYYQLALLTTSNTEEALSYFNKIIEIDPSLASDVYYNIAVLYSLKKDTKKVVEYINKATKADPSSLKPHYFMALYWEENGDFKRTVDSYCKIVELEPQNTEALNRLGELYISTGNINMAEYYFRKTLENNIRDRKALWWMSLIEENRKNYLKAAEYLSQVNDWDKSVEHVLKMSFYQIMIGSTSKAVEILEDAFKKWPTNPEIAYYLGLARMDENKYGEARKYFEIALSTYSDSYDLRYNLGVVCEKLNDVDCFKKNFGYILMKKPDEANVLNYLGYSLIDRDIIDDKIIVDSITLPSPFEMIQKAVSKDSNNYAYLDSLAWAYYKKGDYNKAYEYIEKALSLMNSESNMDPLVLEHKADILSMLGKYDEAYKFYFQSFLLDNSDRRKIIKESARKIFDKVQLTGIYETIINNTTMPYVLGGNVRISFEYRKFISKKRFNYTLSAILINDNNFEIKILGPLMLDVFNAKVMGRVVDITSLSDYSTLYEKQIKDMVFLLNSYFKINDMFIDKRPIKYQNGSFIFNDVFHKGDSLIFSYRDNFFLIDDVVYISGSGKYELKILDFRYRKNLLYPDRFFIKGKNFSIEFEFNNLEMKNE